MNFTRYIFSTLAMIGLVTVSRLNAQTVTTTAGLVAALSSANASPAVATTVTLTSGTYTLTADLPSLAANGLTLRGPTLGEPAVLDATGLASGVIFNVNADHVAIYNITLRNARTHAITIQPGADEGRIEDCSFKNTIPPLPATAAIDGNGCTGWVVTGNSISNIVGTTATAEPAIHFYGGASGTEVSNNLILNCDRAVTLGGEGVVNPPVVSPVITTQPQSVTVTMPGTATFTVVASGVPGPAFQWRKNGASISGATAIHYTTPATTTTDNNTLYSVVVTNSAGSAISNNATLTVNSAPGTAVITSQPQNASVNVGQTATFSVTATGNGAPEYQWTKNGTPISGARFSSYTTPITSLGDSGSIFSVVVTDASAGSVTSSSATLTVSTGTRRTQHYVDPVNGTTAGDGSSASPWKTLQDVITQKVETRTWEAPLPYVAGKNLVAVNASAAVQAGDTIWLRNGDYGTLTIQSTYNVSPITIATEPGSEARFSKVLVQSSQNWILRGFTVSPSYATTYSTGTIVTVENHNWRGPAYDVVIDGFTVFSVPNESVWTLASDWDTKAASAIGISGDRVMVRNCQLRNVRFGISVDGKACRVERNTVDGYCGDGMRGLGDEGVFEYNLIKNQRQVNANHADGFQSWSLGSDGSVGTGVVKNITLRGNVFIAYESPTTPFVAGFQGIGCFDGTFDNWTVENNVIISETYHGIAFYGARNIRILNNTVLDLDPTNTVTPWIVITAHKNGTVSRDCLIRNNLTTVLSTTANVANNIVVDHNKIVPKIPAGYFVDFAHFNFRLAAGSPAIDQGSADQAPVIDADEKVRPQGAAFDLGAYEYTP